MHSSDNQLQLLLSADERASNLQSISSHVEQCVRCQKRLQELSGEGRWTSDLVDHLRHPALSDLTTEFNTSSQSGFKARTLILSHPSDAIENEVELDPISLDFLDEPTHPELLGRLGRYDVESLIGAGGMGVVLKGFDGDLHRPVAIKVLAPHLAHSAAARKRFAREAQAIAAVIHPHVIPIYNVEVDQKLPYLVMSFIDGPSLQAHVDVHGPLPIEVSLRIAQQTAVGLAAAHAQGLIHRDVKPANILLDGNTLRVVLSDFGLARMVDDASMTRTGIVTGTPHYMSPEQAGGETIDCRSDLFSLGCVLWFMLTGRPPFRAATAMGVLNKICHTSEGDIRSINPQVPVPLAAIVVKLLNKSAAGRFQSAQEVEQALNKVLSDWQSGSFQRADQSSRRRQVIGWALAACLCIAVVGTAGWRLLATRGAATQANRLPSIQLNAGQALPLGTLGNTSNQQVFPSPLGQSLSQQLRTDPWYQRFEKLATDVQILENRDTDGMESRAWLNRSFLQPEATAKEINETLDAMEKDSAAWRELIKSSQF